MATISQQIVGAMAARTGAPIPQYLFGGHSFLLEFRFSGSDPASTASVPVVHIVLYCKMHRFSLWFLMLFLLLLLFFVLVLLFIASLWFLLLFYCFRTSLLLGFLWRIVSCLYIIVFAFHSLCCHYHCFYLLLSILQFVFLWFLWRSIRFPLLLFLSFSTSTRKRSYHLLDYVVSCAQDIQSKMKLGFTCSLTVL